MQSSLIGKIEKARRYAEEPERVQFRHLEVTFRGDHDLHRVRLTDGQWHCECDFFSAWHTCSHVMALQRLLGAMLPEKALEPIALT
jgi:hypothetical protein